MQDIQLRLQRFQRDVDYYQAHYEELLEQYPEQWVAIFQEKVVGASPDLEDLLNDLKQHGVPVESVLTEYLTHKDEIWLLSE